MSSTHTAEGAKSRRTLLIRLLPWLAALGLSLFVVRSSIASLHRAQGSSDEPTIEHGAVFAVNRMAYGLRLPLIQHELLRWAEPKRGDIVLFTVPGTTYLATKRVAGVPGDKVEIRASRLIVNGTAATYSSSRVERPTGAAELEELLGAAHLVVRSAHAPSRTEFGPNSVPPGRYFLLGDNREESLDSRDFGTVSREAILGRVIGPRGGAKGSRP